MTSSLSCWLEANGSGKNPNGQNTKFVFEKKL